MLTIVQKYRLRFLALFLMLAIMGAGAPHAHADPYDGKVNGPTPGSGSFVPGTLKCYGTKDQKTGIWSLTIEGDWASQRKADFALFYYGTSDPESNPDMSGALGPVIDSHYHVTLSGIDGELSQPVSRVLPTDGKPRHLKFELDGISPDQLYTLAGVWEDRALVLHSDKMYPLVTMSVDHPATCS